MFYTDKPGFSGACAHNEQQETFMTFRINANSAKNAMGTVFLLAAAFFVCSTLVSMRSVFADPIIDTNAAIQKSGRKSPRSTANTRANTARTTVSRATSAAKPASRTAVSRGTATNRNVAKRSVTPTRSNTVSSRNVVSRNNSNTNRTTNNRVIRARTSATPSRVSATGNVMASGSRAVIGNSTTYSYLSSKLYTGSYSNIIDPTTGLISADAYSNCLEGYYTCMDEICTARSDTKGRCACAGRATNFLEAEQALERANEELIKLSGQLSLLIATKGQGKDLEAAFSLTDAEKVMNCVSYKENVQTKKMSESDWYAEHPTVTDTSGNIQTSGLPSYCNESGNSFGFDISRIDGSSSDILSQLKSWADAKDLAKDYTTDNTDILTYKTNYITNLVNNLGYVSVDGNATDDASVDTLANKWGYKLFEYAHNNVCGRVLDSCFNGIYEACGTPVSVRDSDGKTHNKCANGATSSCPFNYNSYISVKTSGDNEGDVQLNERGSSNSTASTSASCFGYTTTTASGTTVTSTRTVSSASSDPYYSLRGPVADARRSIMQKYLLDANSACDVYGNALKQTAQNINYQKIAAEQALQQKRLEFKQEAESTALAEASAAIDNFNECISEIWDCYEQYENEDRWTTARVKAYCSQVSQVPHCYETMICSPLKTQLTAVIDMPDSTNCDNSDDFTENTCRNVVTISEILYGTGTDALTSVTTASKDSAGIREYCLQQALQSDDGTTCDKTNSSCLRGWEKPKSYAISYSDGMTNQSHDFEDTYSTGNLPYTFRPQEPTKSGYTFVGWCLSSKRSGNTCSETISKNLKIPENTSGALEYYSIWQQNSVNN